MFKKSIAGAIVCVMAASSSAFAQSDQDVLTILKKADAATLAVKSVTYEGEFYGYGMYKSRLPRIVGEIRAKEGRKSILGALLGKKEKRGQTRLWAKGEFFMPGSEEDEAGTAFTISTDGNKIYRINESARSFLSVRVSVGGGVLSAAERLYMLEFLHPTPFSDEINAKKQVYEGKQTIGDVECHVIHVVYQNNSLSRWFFGVEDFLPRRVDRIMSDEDGDEGGYTLQIRDVEINPEIDNAIFTMDAPEEYRIEEFIAPGSDKASAMLLQPGTEAPNWTLPNAEGESVSLKDLRGQVVVLDFWATWCAPCKQSMPQLQQLHDKFADQPVMIVGVNIWENGDPRAFLKDKSYSYDFVFKADKLAEPYRIASIPTFYVIDQNGTIVFASAGYTPDKGNKIAKAIKKCLADND